MVESLTESTVGIFQTGLSVAAKYSWVLWVIVGLAVVFGILGIGVVIAKKKKQWSHKLEIERVLPNGQMMEGKEIIKMRRYPLIRTTEVFELEKTLLGSYLITELDRYTGKNTYAIILDSNNRIYTPTGRTFVPDKSSINVSARHSEIDNMFGEFKQKYQEVHRTQKRVEWGEIAKWAAITLLIIGLMIVAVKWIENEGSKAEWEAAQAQAQAQAWQTIQEVQQDMESNTNANILLAEKLKELYGTRNLQPVIREVRNETL